MDEIGRDANRRTEERQLILEQQLNEVARRNGISVGQLIIQVFARADREEETDPTP